MTVYVNGVAKTLTLEKLARWLGMWVTHQTTSTN